MASKYTPKRRYSRNISDQENEGTCYAHSTARVLLKAIKQIVPKFFYTISEDACDDIYSKTVFNDLTNYITVNKCGEETTNNLLMFAYIYKMIRNEFGCNGNPMQTTLEWALAFLKTDDFGSEDTIKHALPGISEKHMNKIQDLCATFRRKFYEKQNNDLIWHSGTINTSTPQVVKEFQDVLDKGFYIMIHGTGHVVVIVGYETNVEGNVRFIVKNSYNKITCIKDTRLQVPCIDGVLKVPSEKLLESKYGGYKYVFPEHWDSRNEHEALMTYVKKELTNPERKGGNKRSSKKRSSRRRKTSRRKRYAL